MSLTSIILKNLNSMSLSKHHSDMTRHPFFFMQEEGDTPRNHGEMEYEETPCFNQLDGSLKKLR